MKKIFAAVLLAAFVLAPGESANATGECGLSCCIAGATNSGVTLAPNFGVSLSYENSYMKTIKSGTEEVGSDDVIARNRLPMKSYKVPTEMVMQKVTLIGAIPVDERLALMASVPYVVNDMRMRSKSAMGMVMDMQMETVSGLGDASFMGLYTLYADAPIRPTERVAAGFGLKTPTGSTMEKTSSGTLVHAMMQPGSGSWDPLFMVNYMRAYYPVVLQANLFYQWTTEGRNGYEFGDRFSYDLSARYQAAPYWNVGVELAGLHTEKDDDRGAKYSQPETSMVDNTGFTGIDSVLVTPLVQAKIPGSGGSVDLRYQLPVYQRAGGFQQVLDWRAIASLSWVF